MAPRKEIQFQEMRDRSVQKITTAAFELFSTQGYKNSSVAQIAKHAGISKGLIYNYFKSKEAVLEAVLNSFINLETEITDNGESSLKDMLDKFFDLLETQTGFLKLIISFTLDVSEMEIVKKFIHTKINRTIPMTENMLKNSGINNPKDEAWFLSTLLEGCTITYITAMDEYPLDKMKTMIYKRYKIESDENN